ncbi:MAG: zinc-ribbon domain-containing protein [Marinosulfonomonas sp.]|nr:zinc-ribbon domain-containing protein [Marinosulfonomonas sp.]
MRLICPNCDAQYEVDDSAIPKGGRDVQCSSCGKTWFQKSAAQLDEGDTAEVIAPPPAPQEPEVEPRPAEPEPQPDPAPAPEPEPRKPDAAVLDVLRQEAALETETRQNEAQGGLETQPDLGLDQSDSSTDTHAAISERTARLRGIEPEIDKNTPRSDLLPDIEEINSTLRAESDVKTEVDVTEKKRGRRGFRLGFGLVITLATLLLLAYIYAPQIIEKMPASEPYMNSYVEKVNGLRDWLDQLMQTATAKMSGTASGS